MTIHAGMLGYSATLHSPTLNEPAHLVAGLSHWEFGRFDLYRVNPPITRAIAALPVIVAGYETDWSSFHDDAGSRPVFVMGANFIKANGERSIWLFTIARWACIPISIFGCWVAFRFSEDLYGSPAGLAAATLWCFSPNILAHAELITSDCAATVFGMAATYYYWNWLKKTTWQNAISAGIFLAFAELAKTTWIILFLLWPLLWFFWFFTDRNVCECKANHSNTHLVQFINQLTQLLMIQLLALYILNLAYGFEGSLTELGQYQFVSSAFTGNEKSGEPGNRFRKTFLEKIPVPLPSNYFRGIDVQKKDFESYQQLNYLRGEWKDGGWWYYYLYALAVKGALGIWLLLIISLVFRVYRTDLLQLFREELILVTPPLTVLVLASSQTEINAHLRYVLPVIGFAVIYISRAFITLTNVKSTLMLFVSKVLLISCSIWAIFSTLYYYPHQLAYFNELVGGPENGWKHLLGSNLDWGQDLLFIRNKLEPLDSPEEKHNPYFIFSHVLNYAPEDLGLKTSTKNNFIIPHKTNRQDDNNNPRKDYLIISKNRFIEFHLRRGQRDYDATSFEFEQRQWKSTAIDKIGFTHFIFSQ
ncbi:ArnT family glycosyltransferase [Gimesia chilikensis]|uniref:ArnT family glycosyltransferase n=1 Tax=Gimesia chilikensis TaxID=2605989 RepID=UPI0016590FD2|nr:glycosyltransferase family 39 protein [Gimesia chilikensis]